VIITGKYTPVQWCNGITMSNILKHSLIMNVVEVLFC